MDDQVLALYDFRSKQEFIYRTNRMREITGASELIAGMYSRFLDALGNDILADWKSDEPAEAVNVPAGKKGVVIYEGGGNLCILFKDRQAYVDANKLFSRIVLEKAYTLSMISACAPWTDDFESSRKAVYAELDRKKRIDGGGVPCNVLPYSQVDRSTFQPIVSKPNYAGGPRQEMSRESALKLKAFEEKASEDAEWLRQGRFIDDIAADKGTDSLIAIIYSDGNSIGDKLKERGSSVAGMRRFSQEVHEELVVQTEQAVKKTLSKLGQISGCESMDGYRVVVDHGDEITLICNAHAAPFVLDAYFRSLGNGAYSACAGVAFCHSHDPFREAYRIAEECCESGKAMNRATVKEHGSDYDASYIDFHFCRSGITGSLEQIREAQEAGLTARPYRWGSSYERFTEVGQILACSKLKRADLKELNRAILRGESWYQIELERLRAKDPDAMGRVGALLSDAEDAEGAAMKTVLFDVTSIWDVYDKWFELGASWNEAILHV